MAAGETLHKSVEQFPQESSGGVFSYALSIVHELMEIAETDPAIFRAHLPAPEGLSEADLEKIAGSFRDKGWDASIAPIDAEVGTGVMGVCVMSSSS